MFGVLKDVHTERVGKPEELVPSTGGSVQLRQDRGYQPDSEPYRFQPRRSYSAGVVQSLVWYTENEGVVTRGLVSIYG